MTRAARRALITVTIVGATDYALILIAGGYVGPVETWERAGAGVMAGAWGLAGVAALWEWWRLWRIMRTREVIDMLPVDYRWPVREPAEPIVPGGHSGRSAN